MNLVKTTYKSEDVTVLLESLNGKIEQTSVDVLEKNIMNGVHYSRMYPREEVPTKEYQTLFEDSLSRKKKDIARYIKVLAHRILDSCYETPVLISFARAGTPFGILIKRYLNMIGCECNHYSISIIRDLGIDINALKYIRANENSCLHDYCFIDGWTGKGAISRQLTEAVRTLSEWDGLRDDLYVIADPANIAKYCGTKKDIIIPSACLNATVSGMFSRSIRCDTLSKDDLDGAVFISEYLDYDCSNRYLDIITKELELIQNENVFGDNDIVRSRTGMEVVEDIMNKFYVSDFNLVKPSIGETSRVLLRRVPRVILYNTTLDDPDIAHIVELCKVKRVNMVPYDLGNYKVCGIIKGKGD